MIPLRAKAHLSQTSKGMSMKLRILSLFIVSLLAMPKTQGMTGQGPVRNVALQAAVYWSIGHLVNYVGHYMGQFVATEYLNLKGDAVVTPRLSIKYITNTAGREFFGKNKNPNGGAPANHLFDVSGFDAASRSLYLPDVAAIDIPGELRKTTLPLNARAWEAGRNYYTMYECIAKNGVETWDAWHKLHKNLPPFDDVHAVNQTQNASQYVLPAFLESPFAQTVMRDGQLVGLALLYFYIANRVAALGFRAGMATVEFLPHKITWTKHFGDTALHTAGDVTVFRLDPVERLVSSAICTLLTQTGKYYLVSLIKNGLDYLKLYDSRYDEFLLAVWKLGDKSLWAYYGLRSQFEALGASYKDTAWQQFFSVIRSVVPAPAAAGHPKAE